MLINPKIAIEQGWIKFPEWMPEEQRQKCIQPNAIDFTLDDVFIIARAQAAVISESTKVMKKTTPLTLHGQYWNLDEGIAYDAMSDFYVEVPEKVAALLIIRSTCSRSGMRMNNGLYDSGYKGNIGFALQLHSGPVSFASHTRVGQIMFIQSDSEGVYAGGYNREQGQHWQG